MKSVTVHNMSSELSAHLERRAREGGISLNKAIKCLLAEALGIAPQAASRNRRRFDDLCGVWSSREAKTFEKAVEAFERADPEDWR